MMFGVRLGVAVGVTGTTGGVRGAPMGGRMLEGGTGGSDVSWGVGVHGSKIKAINEVHN